jgi:hypothetical protein
MKIKISRHNPLFRRISAILIGVLLCTALPYPWIGVVAAATIEALALESTSWKAEARRGATTGSIVIFFAGLVIIPPRISQRGFAFWDTFIFDMLLGGMGSAVVGSGSAAGIGCLRKAL